MKKRRLNLFQELVQGPKKGSATSAPVKLGAHGIISIVMGIFFIAMVVPGLWSYRRNTTEMEERIVAARVELNKLMEQTTEVANQIAEERKLAALNPNGAPPKEAKDGAPTAAPIVGQIVPIDQTWTSVLWKLSTFTSAAIVITKMDFQDGKDKNAASPTRKVIIDGQAGSQAALTDWMDQLANTMPTAELVMDKQTSGGKESHFPIDFKVTATIL